MTRLEDPGENLLAIKFSYLLNPIDQPEDEAILSDVALYPAPGVVRGKHPSDIPFPSAAHRRNFSGEIAPYMMKAGREYYRVVGAGLLAAGSYWTDALPTPADVRTKLAIRNEWNGDQGLVTLVPKTPVPAWAGLASSQHQTGWRTAAKRRWLIGGGFQLWVPRGMVDRSTGDWRLSPLSGSEE